MNKCIDIPEALVDDLMDGRLLCGNVIVSTIQGTERVNGSATMPLIVFRSAMSQLLLLVCMHNNLHLFTQEDIGDTLVKLNFNYNEENAEFKKEHIDCILDPTHKLFIDFINELLVRILNAYLDMPTEDLINYMDAYLSSDMSDLRTKDGITLIHSILLRTIMAMVYTDDMKDEYDNYSAVMLPMSKIHRLYEEEYAVQRAKEILDADNVMTSDENCIFNKMLVYHTAICVIAIFDDIIAKINSSPLLGFPSKVKKLVSDGYNADADNIERYMFAADKLLNLDYKNKVLYDINMEVKQFSDKIFKPNFKYN